MSVLLFRCFGGLTVDGVRFCDAMRCDLGCFPSVACLRGIGKCLLITIAINRCLSIRIYWPQMA